MSMKTILVPMENHDAMQSALETALLLGRRSNSYIEGFALRWPVIELAGGIDVMGGLPLDRFKEDIEEEAKKAKQIFETFMQKHDVPRATETTASLSFGWLDDAPEGAKLHWQLWPRFRRDSDETARCALEPHARQSDRIWPVRERSADTTVSTVAATPDRHQRVDRMELQHRAGTSHCSCDAASSESRSRYGPDGHWRNGSAGTLG